MSKKVWTELRPGPYRGLSLLCIESSCVRAHEEGEGLSTKTGLGVLHLRRTVAMAQSATRLV